MASPQRVPDLIPVVGKQHRQPGGNRLKPGNTGQKVALVEFRDDGERSFSDLFLKAILDRSMRVQADLVDQLFNSSEKRLARILLLMAEFGKHGEPEQYIPKISQETLAEMIGTTRSRVSFFMNRFRKLGFIEYNERIKVHKSLLNAVLLDQMSERKPERPIGSAAAAGNTEEND